MGIKERVIQVIADTLIINFGDEEITDQTTSMDLCMDSIDEVEIIMALEDEFDLDITDEDANKFDTVGDIVAFLERVVKP